MKYKDKAKNINNRPHCGNCLHIGFNHHFETCDNRPEFVCQRCKKTWTCGLDGGEYIEASQGQIPWKKFGE